MEQITIALAKGRLLEPAVDVLRKAGVWKGGPPATDGIVLDREGLRVIVIRDDDVPTYVALGAADMGIVGKDVLLEQGKDVVELGDLGIGRCRLVVAAPKTPRRPQGSLLRVATKYASLAESFLLRKGYPFQVIRVHGATELAPAMGLSDAIVDLVQTGKTLERNGLAEIEEILSSSARLIVNPASYTMKQEQIRTMASAITAAARNGGSGNEGT